MHRIGRTARAGASGVALSFCDRDERDDLRAIERLTRNKVQVVQNHPYAGKNYDARSRSGAGSAARRSARGARDPLRVPKRSPAIAAARRTMLSGEQPSALLSTVTRAGTPCACARATSPATSARFSGSSSRRRSNGA